MEDSFLFCIHHVGRRGKEREKKGHRTRQVHRPTRSFYHNKRRWSLSQIKGCGRRFIPSPTCWQLMLCALPFYSFTYFDVQVTDWVINNISHLWRFWRLLPVPRKRERQQEENFVLWPMSNRRQIWWTNQTRSLSIVRLRRHSCWPSSGPKFSCRSKGKRARAWRWESPSDWPRPD